MSFNSTIADALTRIRNAIKARHSSVMLMHSGLVMDVLGVLSRSGYIGDFQVCENDKGFKYVELYLKYSNSGAPAISELSLVSTSSRRAYSPVKKLSKFRGGYGIFVVTTSRGVLSDQEARDLNVGGEVICKVF